MLDLHLKPYVPPKITHLPFIAFTKHFTRAVTPAASAPDEEFDAAELVSKYGTPLFVVSEQKLRADFRKFLGTFSDPGIDTRVAYSVKTNYLPAVCSILRSEGALAEVVSGMEYELCRSLGFAPAEIIFNGPHKTHEELTRALGEGALVNIDNFDELDKVEQIAATLSTPARIGIRISFHYGAMPWTKFGFSDDNGDSQRALERIARNARLRLELLHDHCGTFVLVHALYAAAADRLIGLAKRARALGLAPRMLDFGGGYPSSNTLRPEYDFAGGSVRDGDFWTPYAEAIRSRLLKAKDLFGGRPTLVLEPGRAVVDACTQLLCTVVARKSINKNEDAIIVDAGVNLVPTACYYDHPVSRIAGTSETTYPKHRAVKVFGPLCMQSDRLRESAPLPPLNVGDIVRISHVGAYCHTMSMQFIQTRPATVLVGPAGQEIVRRREEWRDVFALDELPSRLRGDGCSF
jgi:diaminopimelate decarboxylase